MFSKLKNIFKRISTIGLATVITFSGMNFSGISLISNVVDVYAADYAYDHYFHSSSKNSCGSSSCTHSFEIHGKSDGAAGCIGPFIKKGQTVSFKGLAVCYGKWSNVKIIITNSTSAAKGPDIVADQVLATIISTGDFSSGSTVSVDFSATAKCDGYIGIIGNHDNTTDGNRYVRLVSVLPNIHSCNSNGKQSYGSTATNTTTKCYYTYCNDSVHGSDKTNNKKDVDHSFTSKSRDIAYLKSAATCAVDAVYYYKCANCNAKGSSTWTDTDSKAKVSHSYEY